MRPRTIVLLCIAGIVGGVLVWFFYPTTPKTEILSTDGWQEITYRNYSLQYHPQWVAERAPGVDSLRFTKGSTMIQFFGIEPIGEAAIERPSFIDRLIERFQNNG